MVKFLELLQTHKYIQFYLCKQSLPGKGKVWQEHTLSYKEQVWQDKKGPSYQIANFFHLNL